MSSGSVRVGVVGCGDSGREHVRVLSAVPQVSRVVTMDSRSGALAAVRAVPAGMGLAPDDESVLDDIDALCIATPPESHARIALRAIAAGKHVFVEKPMTRSTAEADEVIAAAEAAGVVLAVGHTSVHDAAVHRLIELAHTGELGTLHHINAARLNLGHHREDINAIWDLAADHISITLAIMGRLPDEVAAWGMCHTSRFAEDVACVRLVYREENVDSTVRVSWLDPLKVQTTTLVGSKKMAVCDDMAAERVKILDRRREHASDDQFASHLRYRYGDIHCPRIDFSEPLRVQAEDFVQALLTGTEPVAGGHAGRDVVAVLEACDESLARRGRPVSATTCPSPARVLRDS